jgi:acetylornithine/succinyldiaminopimelate/putrescine aminotransferase
MSKLTVLIDRGEMQYVYDENGKKYLDGFGGICTVGVGHCHPVVVDALTKQATNLWHSSSLYRVWKYCLRVFINN